MSIDEVAKLASVSTATVSRALSGRGHVSDATRHKVLAAAESVGYVVSASASSLASGRTRNIGVVVPFLDRWFFSTVLTGVASALMRRGFDITLYSVTDDADMRHDVFATFLRRQRIDGVIAISLELEDSELERLAALNMPVIAIGGPNPRLTTLSVDDVAMARLATEHLIGLGHRDIAHIGASPQFDIDYHMPTRRRQGFEQALSTAGIRVDPSVYETSDFTIEAGFRATQRLLDREGAAPTAIFAASDEMAIGAVLAARERGVVVPRDLSVIGIDGHELGEFFRLTTVDQNPLGQGERAATAILDEIDRDPDATATTHVRGQLPFDLVVRATTGRPGR